MQHFTFSTYLFIIASLFLYSCATSKTSVQNNTGISSLRYVDSYVIPFNLKYKNTTVGGLSGIDYDAKSGLFYLVSDDRSDKNPARFYTARIFISQKGIDSFTFIGVENMLQPDGKVYPGNLQNRFKTPDPEAIRYNPKRQYLAWSSEGERIVKANDTVLTDPSVIMIRTDGKYIDSFALPANMKMNVAEKPRMPKRPRLS